MSETITRKKWLITGVSSGIGRSLAEAALAEGHFVVGTVRKPDQIVEFERLSPGHAMAVLLDVTKPDSVVSGVETAAKMLGGRIDVLVNNAGWGLVGAIEETSIDQAHDVFEANFFGQLNVTRAVLPIMRAQGAGHILAASAIGGFTGFAGLGVYSAAKAAVDVMNEALALEVAPFGITVTVLTLGIFRTNFASSSLKTTTALAEYAETPAGRFRGFIGGLDGKQPNDPARAAQAILQAVAAENPPLHLALGRDALGVIRKKIAGLEQGIAGWEATSASVAFPQSDAERDPATRWTDRAWRDCVDSKSESESATPKGDFKMETDTLTAPTDAPHAINDRALDQLFREARTHNGWLDRPVPGASLRSAVELAKMAPTSANTLPMRVVFVTSADAKARLKPALLPQNVEKTMAAPATAIVGYDLGFPDLLPKLFPHADARSWYVGKDELIAETAFRNSSLQGAYLILALRAIGLDVGPMSGFDPATVDAAFFAGTQVRTNFLLNVGYGDTTKLFARSPRLGFDEIARFA